MFTLFACLGGTIVNLLRPRLSMMVGSLGYPLYIGGLWYYDRTGQTWFPLFGGAMLGVLCGILWTCAGMIAFSYAEEKEKGLASSFFSNYVLLSKRPLSDGLSSLFVCNG
jgi:hypothetical protein